jgi:hypothetical protein
MRRLQSRVFSLKNRKRLNKEQNQKTNNFNNQITTPLPLGYSTMVERSSSRSSSSSLGRKTLLKKLLVGFFFGIALTRTVKSIVKSEQDLKRLGDIYDQAASDLPTVRGELKIKPRDDRTNKQLENGESMLQRMKTNPLPSLSESKPELETNKDTGTSMESRTVQQQLQLQGKPPESETAAKSSILSSKATTETLLSNNTGNTFATKDETKESPLQNARNIPSRDEVASGIKVVLVHLNTTSSQMINNNTMHHENKLTLVQVSKPSATTATATQTKKPSLIDMEVPKTGPAFKPNEQNARNATNHTHASILPEGNNVTTSTIEVELNKTIELGPALTKDGPIEISTIEIASKDKEVSRPNNQTASLLQDDEPRIRLPVNAAATKDVVEFERQEGVVIVTKLHGPHQLSLLE